MYHTILVPQFSRCHSHYDMESIVGVVSFGIFSVDDWNLEIGIYLFPYDTGIKFNRCMLRDLEVD